MDQLSERLRSSLEALNLPVKALASISGYSEGYIRRLLSGEQRNPSIFAVEALAKSLNVSPVWLAGWSE